MTASRSALLAAFGVRLAVTRAHFEQFAQRSDIQLETAELHHAGLVQLGPCPAEGYVIRSVKSLLDLAYQRFDVAQRDPVVTEDCFVALAQGIPYDGVELAALGHVVSVGVAVAACVAFEPLLYHIVYRTSHAVGEY